MAEKKDNCSDREIIISRVFEAPVKLVWEAWTNPQHIVNWWGPVGFSTTISVMDVRPGGIWELVMHGPDGTKYPNRSEFKEVVKHERIVFTLSGGREGDVPLHFIMTWTFKALSATRTELTIHQVYETAEMRNKVACEYGAIEGGKETLQRLNDYLPKVAG